MNHTHQLKESLKKWVQLGFRHWLEEHDLTQRMFEVVGQLLQEQGLLVTKGTIMDATIIHALSSTKNRRGEPT